VNRSVDRKPQKSPEKWGKGHRFAKKAIGVRTILSLGGGSNREGENSVGGNNSLIVWIAVTGGKDPRQRQKGGEMLGELDQGNLGWGEQVQGIGT